MKGQVIGKTMLHGYAGSYSRQPDMVVDTHPHGGKADIPFGFPVAAGADGAVAEWAETSTAGNFVGVAVREIKSATDYMNQNMGTYRPGEALPVLKRGCVNVICQNGTPAAGKAVYVRTKKNGSFPNAVVGGFEAAEDTTNSVKLSNVQWKGNGRRKRSGGAADPDHPECVRRNQRWHLRT